MSAVDTQKFSTLAALSLAQKTNEVPIEQLLKIHQKMVTNNNNLVQYVRANRDYQEYLRFVQSASMSSGS